MTSPRQSADFLDDIRSAAQKAREFASGLSFTEFAADEKNRCLPSCGHSKLSARPRSAFRKMFAIPTPMFPGARWLAFETS